MKDWLVRVTFIIIGLLLYWLVPDPYRAITGSVAVAGFLWMVVVAAREK